MQCQTSYNACMSSTRAQVRQMFEAPARTSKKQLCAQQRHCGAGVLCGKTLKVIKRQRFYRDLPRGTVINGRTKSRARKADLCAYLDQPRVLMARLDPSMDPAGVLSAMPTLENSIRQHCGARFRVDTPLFQDMGSLMKILHDTPDRTVAHVTLITHGNRQSIQVGGAEEDLTVDEDAFGRFADEVRRVMMDRGHVLLVACYTGDPGRPVTEDEKKAGLTVVQDASQDNFANCLAQRAQVPVFATPGPQYADEILVGRARGRGNPECSELPHPGVAPLNYTFHSNAQTMFKYLPV